MELCTSVGLMALKENYVGGEGTQKDQRPELPDLAGIRPILVDRQTAAENEEPLGGEPSG
jgi:hypothetical protein